MGKVFGILLIVVCIWVGLEVMNKGVGGAFDGAFVRMGVVSQDEAAADQPLSERAAEAWQGAHRRAQERVDRQLGE
jgi:hypothetical protein